MYVTENRLHISFISFHICKSTMLGKMYHWHTIYMKMSKICIPFSLLFLSSFFYTPSSRCFNYTAIFIGLYSKWFYYHLETPCYPNGNTVNNQKKNWVHFDGNYVDCVMSSENIVKHERKNFLSVLQCYCLINKWRLDVVNISFVCFGILCCVHLRSSDRY